MKKNSLIINYIKTNSYRTYHVDGVHGGLTPKLNLYMDLFIDRNVTPKKIEHKIDDEGTLSKGTVVESLEGAVREIECGLIMDIKTAKSIHKWLGNQINQIEELNQLSKMGEKTNEL